MIPVCLALAWLGSMHWAGRVSGNLSFVPHLDVYVYFGICFALGWLMQQRMDDLVILGDRWTRYIAIASGLFLVALFSLLLKGAPEEPGYLPLHAVLSLATGFSVGYYMLAFVGLFSRHCSAYNPWVRYFSDSAYWIFIFHSIPLVLLALALYPLAIAAEWKFLIVTTGTLTICLVSYQLFVRNGWIGEVLNGRRYETVPWIRRT
jgi:glucan biosynthesis protein C